MSSKDIGIGIIGTGGRGCIARYAHQPKKGVVVRAGCDIRLDALRDFTAAYGADTFTTTDYRELLKRRDIHAVMVTTPDYLHEEHAVAALHAGKAVFCEKPLAITTAGADRILAAAKETGSGLFVGHNMRYMAFTRKMRSLVAEGRIGEVKAAWCRHFISYGGDAYFKDWHADRKKTTGLLLQKGVHDIDIIHWICGADTKRVTAFGSLSVYDRCEQRRDDGPADTSWHTGNWPPLSQTGMNPVINVEDQNMVLMELGNGVLASYLQCHFTPDAWRNYTFIGTEGRIENFGDFTGKPIIRLWNRRSHSSTEGDEEYLIEPDTESHGGADRMIVDDFIAFIKGEAPQAVPPEAARNSVAAAYAATLSLRDGGRPVNVFPETLKN